MMLSVEARGHGAGDEGGEDEVLSECLKQHIKQLAVCCFSLPSASFCWTVALAGLTGSAAA